MDYEVSFEGVVTDYVYDTDVDTFDDPDNPGDPLDPGDAGRLVPRTTSHGHGPCELARPAGHLHTGRGRSLRLQRPGPDSLDPQEDYDDATGSLLGNGSPPTTTTRRPPHQVASPEGMIHYEYDPVTGQRTRTWTAADGTSTDPIEDIRYTYDSLGRLATVEVYEQNDVAIDTDAGTDGNQPETTKYHYDLLGNLRAERKADGLVADYVYDDLNRLDILTEFLDNKRRRRIQLGR